MSLFRNETLYGFMIDICLYVVLHYDAQKYQQVATHFNMSVQIILVRKTGDV